MMPDEVARCIIIGCEREPVARGMCMSHYKRHVVRGHPVPTGREPQVGDPSGHGVYGVMERHETLALCHECGGWYVSVGSHAYAVHDMTAAQYRTEHGLKWTQPLTSLALSRARSELAQARVGSAGWQRLEARRRRPIRGPRTCFQRQPRGRRGPSIRWTVGFRSGRSVTGFVPSAAPPSGTGKMRFARRSVCACRGRDCWRGSGGQRSAPRMPIGCAPRQTRTPWLRSCATCRVVASRRRRSGGRLAGRGRG